jgi:phosphoribosylglycinamide formyltransferase-1
METHPVSIGFLLSGGGRTLENLIEVIRQEGIPAQISLVIASKAGLGGIEKAARAGIPHQIHPCRDTADSKAVFAALDEAGCQFAILGGWLRKLEIPTAWEGRVINIHPSLLPRHGGKGCYGDRVHRRVLEAGDTKSGCTVHFVDNEYDRGPIILQETVPVLEDDSVESLGQRVFEAEKQALPKAVAALISGELDG